MRRIFTIIASALFLISVFASPAMASDESELLGLSLGATAGGVIGNQFGHGAGRVATTTAGVFAGGYIGDEIGRRLDQPNIYSQSSPIPYGSTDMFDYRASYATPNYVAPPAPEPSAIYMDNSMSIPCRQFSQQIVVDDQIRESYGTACLQPDGAWRAVQ